MKKSGSLLLLLAIAGCSRLWAADGALTGDTYVSTVAPNSNFGALTTLNVGGGSTAFVQFDLSSLPAGTTAASIASAQLIFYVDRVGAAGSVDLHAVAASWAETTLTSASSSITPTAFATVPVTGANAFATVDVTGLVQNWIAGTTPNYGIAITAAASASNTQIFLDSKENTVTSHPARLQINLTGAGPTGPQGPTGLAGAQGPPGPTGPNGAMPYPFTTATNSTIIQCSDVDGCSFNQVITVSCPILRANVVSCETPLYGEFTVTSSVPPYSLTDLGCSYVGHLELAEAIEISVTAMCIGGSIMQLVQQ